MRLHDSLVEKVKRLEAIIAEDRNANRDVVIVAFDDAKGSRSNPNLPKHTTMPVNQFIFIETRTKPATISSSERSSSLQKRTVLIVTGHAFKRG